jgi:acetylornithine deacetylase/succinyl-diaminopimelate desuccinylase-like protein
MDKQALTRFVSDCWDSEIIGQLVEYIKIPNKSPMFDANWQANGYMEQATVQLADWAKRQPIAGMQVEIVRLEDRTPLIFIDIPGDGDDCVLMYGHLDKQPEMTGWDDDLGPWLPVIKGDKLYGRGGADDGYALYGSLTAIAALKAQNIAHARTIILIEACEESGSYDPVSYTHLRAHET